MQHSSNMVQIGQQLVRMKILSQADVQSALTEVASHEDTEDFLGLLERRELLTNYQTAKILKGEWDRLVIGDCKLQYFNGEGSFSRLYRAARIQTDHVVALKVLRERWSQIPQAVKLFQREGEIGHRLRHMNIAAVYDSGFDKGCHYIVMEFVEGGTLREFLKTRGKIAPVDVMNYGLQMSRALEAALKVDLTHRDLRMSNVLMTTKGTIKLIDFGLASEEANSVHPRDSGIANALEYQTLESCTGAGRNDPRTDLYFLGVILYELLCGHPPFEKTNNREERKNFNRYSLVRPIEVVEPTLPTCVTSVVSKLMHLVPQRRYQSASQACEAMTSALTALGAEIPATGLSSGTMSMIASGVERVILVVETREKMQTTLRDYFTKHGYRMVLVTDADRALKRLKTSLPHAVVFFADAVGSRIATDFTEALKVTHQKNCSVVAVLGELYSNINIPEPKDMKHGAVLRPPMNLRGLRMAIEAGQSNQKTA